MNTIKKDKVILTITGLSKKDNALYNKGAKRINKKRHQSLPILKDHETVLNISMLNLYYWLLYEGMETSGRLEYEFYSRLNDAQNIIKWNGVSNSIKLENYI